MAEPGKTKITLITLVTLVTLIMLRNGNCFQGRTRTGIITVKNFNRFILCLFLWMYLNVGIRYLTTLLIPITVLILFQSSGCIIVNSHV
jgi:hypothetical protein